ncbi:hypothetical protein F5B21DRAFT_494476 [Xylaria acuta]|nr:hypothetical protein F5B21DRAFT_494476 [Xylaria acuta]
MSKRTIGHEPGMSSVEKRRKTGRPTDQALGASTINPQSTNEDYTIGWICAITTEYVAAQLFLDKKHMRSKYQPREDTNHYTLGEIGGNNVVIAVLPGGEYGTNSAANVANNMLRTFPHIRIGLMVGIGGGAPSKEHDIRLGDVVVSMPSNGYGGVLQYDFGKTIQDRAFCMTGFLDQPPTVLRTTVTGLQVQYEMSGHCLNEAIDITLQKWPKANRGKYGQPDIRTDRLYRADVVHNDQHCCTTATGGDIPELISRPPRTQDAHNPTIHYGLIGSANQLMKDALVRDRLSKEKGVLCFEMEAAGLMNHFPCLVIRGICDYSDSHKNKEWQGYAAMTAAAYTKDLLYQIPPSEVVAEKKISELVLASVSRIEENVEALKSKANSKEDLKVLDWISQVDYGPQQSDFFRRAQPGTCQWFLNSVKYQDWLNTVTKTLFCPGIPGAGKTVLASIVINDLWRRFRKNNSIGIVYIYCNFRHKDEQTLEGLKSIVLKQLAERQSPLPEGLKSLYRDHKAARTRLSPEELSNALHYAFAAYSRVYIVTDALDECEASGGCRDRFLSEIFNAQSNGKVSFMATSRDNPEIQDKFKGSAILEIRANNDDVERYLDDHMLALPAFIKDDFDLRQYIKTGISRAADGMFLLAQLHLDSLKGKMTRAAVRKTLDALVTGSDAYEHAYNSAMERINGQLREEADLAKRVLSWITFAKRPLTTKELQHALSVEIGTSHLDQENLLRVNMVSMCAGLVTIDKESNIIRLVHYTTQQYFEKSFERWFYNPHLDITEICVTYLSFQAFESGCVRSVKAFSARLESNPFYDYASRNWGHHARLAPTRQHVLPFLRKQGHVEATGQALLAYSPTPQEIVIAKITGLHLASYFGLETVGILAAEYDVIERDSSDQTPLLRAVADRHVEIAQMLIENGADTKAKNTWGLTPLLSAIYHKEEDLVQMLLQNGADIEAKDDLYQTPLFRAIERGHKEIVQILLTNGANFEARDGFDGTPLVYAINHKNGDIVQMLLEKGANIEDKGVLDKTPLHYASEYGSKEIVHILLKNGANIEARDFASKTPLWYAILRGKEEVARILLEEGADIDNHCGNGLTVLWLARRREDKALEQLLLSWKKVAP